MKYSMSDSISKWLSRSRYGIVSFFEMLMYMTTPVILLSVALLLSAYHMFYMWTLIFLLVIYGFVMEMLRRRLTYLRRMSEEISLLKEENEKYRKITKRTKRMKNSDMHENSKNNRREW